MHIWKDMIDGDHIGVMTRERAQRSIASDLTLFSTISFDSTLVGIDIYLISSTISWLYISILFPIN